MWRVCSPQQNTVCLTLLQLLHPSLEGNKRRWRRKRITSPSHPFLSDSFVSWSITDSSSFLSLLWFRFAWGCSCILKFCSMPAISWVFFEWDASRGFSCCYFARMLLYSLSFHLLFLPRDTKRERENTQAIYSLSGVFVCVMMERSLLEQLPVFFVYLPSPGFCFQEEDEYQVIPCCLEVNNAHIYCLCQRCRWYLLLDFERQEGRERFVWHSCVFIAWYFSL